MEQRHFCQASLEYVFLLQEVQERKKFEFVETVSYFYKVYNLINYVQIFKYLFYLYCTNLYLGIVFENQIT